MIMTATTTVQNLILRRLYEQETIRLGEMKVGVYELASDATYKDMFRSLSEDLDSLCSTEAQIDQFCEGHRNKMLKDNPVGGYPMLFLRKLSSGEFVVIKKYLFTNGYIGSDMDFFERNDRVYSPLHRIRFVAPLSLT